MSRNVVFSHGFGVRPKGRELFTNIADSQNFIGSAYLLEQRKHSQPMDKISPPSLEEQAIILGSLLDEIPAETPIDLVCHYQGCLVGALAKTSARLGKVIFLAPPDKLGSDRKDALDIYAKLASRSRLTIIQASQDEVLGNTHFGEIPARAITLDNNHDFTKRRAGVVNLVTKTLRD